MAVDTSITGEFLDIGVALEAVSHPECGGIGMFVGAVRSSAAAGGNADKPVTMLEYEAHPTMAETRLRIIAEEAVHKWDLRNVFAHHRSGVCRLGEPTVVVACSAPHRAEALEACRWIIDEIKSTVPIWKREVYSDGSAWVGPEGA